jgi:hypothetical protein
MSNDRKSFKLGRLARSHDKRIPMLHTLMTGAGIAPQPVVASVDYTKGMPPNLGMMLNDTLGDCTCAAYYHAIQVWTYNALGAQQMATEPDSDVEDLYEQACGYKPSQGGEGPGGNEQHVLTFILKKGAPFGPKGQQRHQIDAFVEVDVKNTDNIKRTINDCGVAYIGFNVPQYIMPPGQNPLSVWDVDPAADNTIVGGHAVVLAGYNASGARVISWGGYYTMTWAFFAKFVDEAYAIADPDWISAKKTTPGGLSLQQLEQAMQALKTGPAETSDVRVPHLKRAG